MMERPPRCLGRRRPFWRHPRLVPPTSAALEPAGIASCPQAARVVGAPPHRARLIDRTLPLLGCIPTPDHIQRIKAPCTSRLPYRPPPRLGMPSPRHQLRSPPQPLLTSLFLEPWRTLPSALTLSHGLSTVTIQRIRPQRTSLAGAVSGTSRSARRPPFFATVLLPPPALTTPSTTATLGGHPPSLSLAFSCLVQLVGSGVCAPSPIATVR